MGKTYKHQNKHLIKEWGNSRWTRPYIKVHHGGYIYWIQPPPEKDNYPIPHWKFGIEEGRASYYYKLSYHRLRKRWRRLLWVFDEDRMDKASLKPENMDWVIW